MKYLITNTRFSVENLFHLRQQLLQSRAKTLEVISLTEYEGMKLHMLAHLHTNILRYGYSNPGYYGESSEHYHKEVAKTLWNVVSKRYSTVDKEMLDVHLNLKSLIKRDGHFNWTKYVYFWIPFEWTCRDDSVQMNEFDKPPVATVQARENYFNVAVTEGMLITMEHTNENEIDVINEDDDDCSVALSDYELLEAHF